MTRTLFFCAVGGSGMLPLALIMQSRGYRVCGSDRSYDQGRTPERFAAIAKSGVTLFPQDGSGITDEVEDVIVSAAVEDTVPDYVAARRKNIPVTTRAQLLARLFNAAGTRIGIAGTSGKSTTTGLTGWIMDRAGLQPTVVGGATIKNYVTPETPFASFVIGAPEIMVAELDESDGSIAHYSPTIAVITNISLDHKSLDELRVLFRAYAAKAERCVINLDNDETAALAHSLPESRCLTFSRTNPCADLFADDIVYEPYETRFSVTLRRTGETRPATLPLPGAHNVENALAALGAALAAGAAFSQALDSLAAFRGIARRYDVIGMAGGITVIDDFAHNPDKIAATLRTLRQTAGRSHILFQPHGYGPLAHMRNELAACFAAGLGPEDALYLTDPLYLGGTTSRSVTSADLAQDIVALGGQAIHIPARDAAAERMVKDAQKGDKLVIMGARDDSLATLAARVFDKIRQRKS